MPKVTDLIEQQKDSSRFNLFVDGDFFCGVDQDTIGKFKIKIGQEFTPAELDTIFSESEINKIYQRVLDFLAYRPRSRQEIAQYIKDKIYKYQLSIIDQGQLQMEEVVTAILHRLEELGYLSDEEFVRWWVEQRVNKSKPDGFVKISAELRQKGIRPNLINTVWQDLGANETALVEKHFEEVKHKYDLEDFKDKKRLSDYLQRHGFRWEAVKNVLK